jgi:TM2 domain-containing membrane protein YozV
MSDQPPDAGSQAGMQVSADGQWVWNGSAWVPNPSAASVMPIPYSAPAPAQYTPMAYPTAGGYAIAPKSPALGLIVSFFLPGVGSMINGDVGIGITILLLWLLAWVLDVTVFGLIVGVPLGLGMWIWGLIDGYQGAQRWNRRHGIIS